MYYTHRWGRLCTGMKLYNANLFCKHPVLAIEADPEHWESIFNRASKRVRDANVARLSPEMLRCERPRLTGRVALREQSVD
jgi:hypothetical protein